MTYKSNKSGTRNYLFSTHSFHLEYQEILIQGEHFEFHANLQKDRGLASLITKSIFGLHPQSVIEFDLIFIPALTINFSNFVLRASLLDLQRVRCGALRWLRPPRLWARAGLAWELAYCIMPNFGSNLELTSIS